MAIEKNSTESSPPVSYNHIAALDALRDFLEKIEKVQETMSTTPGFDEDADWQAYTKQIYAEHYQAMLEIIGNMYGTAAAEWADQTIKRERNN